MREIVLDTETTGLSPKDGHKLVEIGCVELVNHVPTGSVYHQYINPERSMPEGAYKVHGLSEKFLRDFPVFKAVADNFLSFVKDSPLVIHNADFDMGFLNYELRSLGYNGPLKKNTVIDTLAMARKKFPGSPASLDALCKRFKVDNAKRVRHGALLDAEILADVYLELIGGRQVRLFKKEKEKTVVRFDLSRHEKVISFAKRSFVLEDSTLSRHQKFIEEKIKESGWYVDTKEN